MVTSPVIFAEDITDGVMLSTVAGAAPLADFAEVVAADATSLADAGILFPGDPAGVVTIGVAPLADAGPVTMAVADLTDAGILFPADPAGVVTVGVAPLADAGMVTVGVTDLADSLEYGDSAMSCVDCVSTCIWCPVMPQIRNDSGCQYVDYVSCVPVSMDYDISTNGDNCTSETVLSAPLCAVMDGVA